MHTPSNRIRPCGELMPPGLFGSTTIDCSACMEKANTLGTTGATGVVVALESVSKMAADITDDRRRNGSHAKLQRHSLGLRPAIATELVTRGSPSLGAI